MHRFHLTATEVELINLYRQLPACDRERVSALLSALQQEETPVGLRAISASPRPAHPLSA